MPPLTVRKRCARWRSRLTWCWWSGKLLNSNRLAELAQRMGKAAYLIDDASDIQEAWVKDAACVSVTAARRRGYSGAERHYRLQELGGGEAVPLEGREENIVFEVPKELRVDVREVE
ncbi:hypothetical protein ACL655_13770 [Klebsiella quasipneumoniae subsp. similipneumoniae]